MLAFKLDENKPHMGMLGCVIYKIVDNDYSGPQAIHWGNSVEKTEKWNYFSLIDFFYFVVGAVVVHFFCNIEFLIHSREHFPTSSSCLSPGWKPIKLPFLDGMQMKMKMRYNITFSSGIWHIGYNGKLVGIRIRWHDVSINTYNLCLYNIILFWR